jgi:Fe-S-cluster-containing dehydrogenase component/DMSO reductase anchor subunit
MQKGFLFDLNKCTGCHACQIACSIENEVPLPFNWRQVMTYNEQRHPKLPVFNLSIACNHCLDAPCLTYCPALAISKDESTGAVLINDKLCIGCKYCSWVCPYDAPLFNQAKGTMDKCTFCIHRLEENLEPACATLCPTSALQISDHPADYLHEHIPGFTPSDIKPAIQIVPLREDHQLPESCEIPFDDSIVQLYQSSLQNKKVKEKISWLPELPLIIFSVFIAFICGSYTGAILTGSKSGNYLPIFIGIGAMAISAFHLGKKFRAPRAVFNFRNSWLSREITFFALFILTMSIQLLFLPEAKWLAWISISAGFLTLYALDNVYSVVAVVSKLQYHSANTVITGLFLASFFADFSFGIIIFGGIKFLLYLKQKISQLKDLTVISIVLGVVRVIFGFIIPLFLWLYKFPETWVLSIILILIAEFIDRCEFYEGLKTISPQKQMKSDLENYIERV